MLRILKWLTKNWLAVACITATFLLLAALCFRLDPDLGWHLRVGKDLALNHIFPRTDFYTFAFQGYTWRDHEWLAEAPLYYLWQLGGYSLLVSVFSFLWFLSFWIAYRERDLIKRSFFVLIAVYLSMSFIGVRLQVLTVLGLAILIRLFSSYLKGNTKLLYLYPLIMLLWANLHGSFVYGLLAGAVFLICHSCPASSAGVNSGRNPVKITSALNARPLAPRLRGDDREEAGDNIQRLCSEYRLSRKVWFQFLLIFLLALSLTFVNPYGLGLWQEIWIALKPGFKSIISEWQPIFSLPAIYQVLIYYVFFTVFLTANYFRKFSFPRYYLVLVAIFFFLGAISKRNVPIFILLSLPVFVECLKKDYLTSRLEALGQKVFRPLVFTLSLVVPVVYLNAPLSFFVNPDPFQKTWGAYPDREIIKKLEKLPNKTPVFASYDFGGYLIYRLPNIKIFIDGRGSYWELGDQLAVKAYLESLKDYNKFEELQKKYGFEVILTGSLNDGFRVDPLTGADLSNYDWQDLASSLVKSGRFEVVQQTKDQKILILKNSPLLKYLK